MGILEKGSFWGGAACGAILLVVLGFWPFGWTLGSSAELMARERAEAAVLAVLVPICVEQGRGASADDIEALRAE